MSRPQPEPLAAFQRQRSARRRDAVTAAIRKLDRASRPVTVAAVAALAGVDRSYIYDHPTCWRRSGGSEARHPASSLHARSPSARRMPPCRPA
jgi:hypothetical protein